MSGENIKVEWIWVDESNKQVGVRVSFGSKATQDIALKELSSLRGRLINADVNVDGVYGKYGIVLTSKRLSQNTEYFVKTYTLMHENNEVCTVFTELENIELSDADKLPFALSGRILTVTGFLDWLNYRIDNLSRMYMNKIYIVRKIGRDRERILRDSCGMSPIDNFWIRRSDVDTSWEELKSKRDKNLDLVHTALTGELVKPPDFTKAEKDTTSLFVIKGAFPKAIYDGDILKKDNNAEYEAAAYQLGRVLGVSVAEAVKTEQSGVVRCKLFTSETVSMAHARDFLHLTDYDKDVNDDWHRALYDYFNNQGRADIVEQLERLYIFNYLVENIDFHYENFGFLYDSGTFKIISVAPAYDFNSAFAGLNDVSVYYPWILDCLSEFLKKHPDIKEMLQSVEFTHILYGIDDLTIEQKNSVHKRAEYLFGDTVV